MADHDISVIVELYAAGRAGTRATIDSIGAADYADLLIALAARNLALPKPVQTRAVLEDDARARAVLMPRLTRGA